MTKPVLFNLALGVTEIFEGVLRILTLGQASPPYSFMLVSWKAKRDCKRAMRNQSKDEQ